MEIPVSKDDFSKLTDEQLCQVIVSDISFAPTGSQPAFDLLAKEAFEELYQRYYPRLCRTVWFFLGFTSGTEEDAEFVANGIMARLYAAIVSNQYDAQRLLKPYVNEVMRNAVRDWHRGSGRFVHTDETVEPPTDDSDSPISQLLAKEQRAMVHQVLASLPNGHREILLLRYVEGLSHEQIEKGLGLTNGALRGRIQRAKERYREEFAYRYGH